MYDKNTGMGDQIDRYLRHQLSAAELDDFEIRMMEDPVFFDAVQQAELMHSSIKEQGLHVRPGTNISYLPFRLWIKQPFSLAASMMLGIGTLLFANFYLIQPGTDGFDNGYGVTSVVNIGQMRSTTSEIVLPGGIHLLQVDVGISLVDTPYLLSLNREDVGQQYIFQVVPDSNGVIRVITPANTQGRYELVVQRLDNEERVGTYHIRFD